MTYGLYSTQLARAWTQRIEKENALADRFWSQQVQSEMSAKEAAAAAERPGTAASRSSSVPSGFTSKTSFLKTRLERLEMDLAAERDKRRRVEGDLEELRMSTQRIEESQIRQLAYTPVRTRQ